MDRDPSENVVDAEDRSTPTTGESPFGEAGAERARLGEARENQHGGKRERADEPDADANRQQPEAVAPSTPLPPD